MPRTLQVDYVDFVSPDIKKMGQVAYNPWEERVKLQISDKIVRSKKEALFRLVTHIMNTVESSVTLRGMIQWTGDSMTVTLANGNKRLTTKYTLNMEDLSITSTPLVYSKETKNKEEVAV